MYASHWALRNPKAIVKAKVGFRRLRCDPGMDFGPLGAAPARVIVCPTGAALERTC